MSRSFLFGLVLSLLSVLGRALAWTMAPVRKAWPEAFPTAPPGIRRQGVRLSIEDAKPAARRVAAYQARVADRHDRRRAIPGLIYAA